MPSLAQSALNGCGKPKRVSNQQPARLTPVNARSPGGRKGQRAVPQTTEDHTRNTRAHINVSNLTKQDN